MALNNNAKRYPQNEILWNNLMRQGKAKYPIKNPNAKTTFPINEWVAKEYARQGGQYVQTKTAVPAKMQDKKARAEKAAKAKVAKAKRDKKRAGFV
jgi:hypothetical protein